MTKKIPSLKKPPREKWLQVRASAAELKEWAKIATAKGMTLSVWVRQALYTEARK